MIWMERRSVQTTVTNSINNLILCSLVFHLIPETLTSLVLVKTTICRVLTRKAESVQTPPFVFIANADYAFLNFFLNPRTPIKPDPKSQRAPGIGTTLDPVKVASTVFPSITGL